MADKPHPVQVSQRRSTDLIIRLPGYSSQGMNTCKDVRFNQQRPHSLNSAVQSEFRIHRWLQKRNKKTAQLLKNKTTPTKETKKLKHETATPTPTPPTALCKLYPYVVSCPSCLLFLFLQQNNKTAKQQNKNKTIHLLRLVIHHRPTSHSCLPKLK